MSVHTILGLIAVLGLHVQTALFKPGNLAHKR